MKRVTLTFDNGPTPGVTDLVLDALRARDMKAVFFPIGIHLTVPGGRQYAERAREAGHRIGNHTFSHGTPLGMRADPKEVVSEIARMQDVLGDLAGDEWLFRPNGGRGRLGTHLLSQAASDYLISHGYTVVTWNCVPHDWELPAEMWIANAMSDIDRQDWSVVVLHDLPTGAMTALPRFLDRLMSRGDIDVVQTFPDDCVPISRGKATALLDELMQ